MSDIITKLTSDEWVLTINTLELYCANTVHSSYEELRKTIRVIDMLRENYQRAYEKEHGDK